MAFTPPSLSQILQARLQAYSASASYFGYNLSISPNGEFYIRSEGSATQDSVLYNLMNSLTNSHLIDAATGAALDVIANDFGLYRRGAISSQGAVQLITTLPQTLVSGTTLTGPNGLLFQVTTSGTYNNLQNVLITCVNQGANTNLGVGSIMSWTAPNPGMQQNVNISVACTGGADTENDDTLRARLYLTLQVPSQMGNSGQIITTAASSDNIIQQAFTYANFNGSGSQIIAVTGYQTFSYIGRDIPHLPFDGYVSIYGTTIINPSLVINPGTGGPYNSFTNVLSSGLNSFGAAANMGPNLSADSSVIYGQLPAIVANPFATVITTTNNIPSDLAAVLTLPYPVGSSPNGFGNGWLDATPWPVPDGYYVQNGYCQVVGVTSSTVITVSAPSSGTYNTNNPNASLQTYNTHTPIQGQTHIQWVNRSDNQQSGWTVVTATVLAATDNGNNTWTITLDTPLVFATGTIDFYGNELISSGGVGGLLGDFIFPACQNAQNYLNQCMGTYSLLGPGEVTSNLGLQALGASRFPSNNNSFPSTVGVQLEKILETNNNEVYQATTNPGLGIAVPGGIGTFYQCYNSAFTAPANGAPPNIYIPHNIAFYPSETYQFGV